MGIRSRLKRLGQSLLDREEDRPAPRPVAPRPVARPADLARAAARDGLDTGATYRLEAPDADVEGFDGSRDPVIGEVDWDDEVRETDDGHRYWGPHDNESARAKAEARVLSIDRDECIGCGTCVEHIDSVFWLDDDEGKAYVLRQVGSMLRIQGAIDACPVTCISWRADGRPDSEALPPQAPLDV